MNSHVAKDSIISEERYVFIRLSRYSKDDNTHCDEKSARAALSAYTSDVDKAIDKMKRGDRVYTRHAVYVAMTVDEWRNRNIDVSSDILYEKNFR